MVLILKWGPECFPMHSHIIWVRSWNCGCLIAWFCYQLIAKPGNKTAAVSVTWPIWAFPSANALPHFTASHTMYLHLSCMLFSHHDSFTDRWVGITQQHRTAQFPTYGRYSMKSKPTYEQHIATSINLLSTGIKYDFFGVDFTIMDKMTMTLRWKNSTLTCNDPLHIIVTFLDIRTLKPLI